MMLIEIEIGFLYCKLLNEKKYDENFWFEKGKEFLEKDKIVEVIKCFYISHVVELRPSGRGIINIAKACCKLGYQSVGVSLLVALRNFQSLQAKYLSASHVVTAICLNQIQEIEKDVVSAVVLLFFCPCSP